MDAAPTIRTKICGLTSGEDVRVAVEAGADAVGFIVDVPVTSPREIDVEQASALADRVPPFVTSTLVTFPENVHALVEAISPDAIQLHGDLPPESVAALRERTGRPVIKTVRAGDADAANAYAAVADAIHVDTTDEAGGGGTGRTHDWEVSAALRSALDVPVVLSGGLTPSNVATAVRTVRPYAVDVASGVERSGGRKDHDAVRSFVRHAQAAVEAP